MIDIFIAGGGYVGLSLAVAVKSAAPHLDVRVYDAAPEGVWEKDERASAIAAGAKRLLTVLGAWDEIAPEAEPIRKMIITDSKTADPVRPVFLTFDGEAEAGEPFAYMVPTRRWCARSESARMLWCGNPAGRFGGRFQDGRCLADRDAL